MANTNFNPVSGFYHFHSMNKNFEEILGSEKMTLKSFFYAIRTALCAYWIYKNETIPPVLFREIYSLIDVNYLPKLDELIVLKSKRIEKSNDPVDAELIHLVKDIANENNKIKDYLANKRPNPSDFNNLFLKTLNE
ncbi:hypothetical protein WPG_1497 [Winogradskyella sp. PG-2]|nr:hypothetical protein WPG_1497 [Winogradskyella sp. PG-2]